MRAHQQLQKKKKLNNKLQHPSNKNLIEKHPINISKKKNIAFITTSIP